MTKSVKVYDRSAISKLAGLDYDAFIYWNKIGSFPSGKSSMEKDERGHICVEWGNWIAGMVSMERVGDVLTEEALAARYPGVVLAYIAERIGHNLYTKHAGVPCYTFRCRCKSLARSIINTAASRGVNGGEIDKFGNAFWPSIKNVTTTNTCKKCGDNLPVQIMEQEGWYTWAHDRCPRGECGKHSEEGPPLSASYRVD